MWISYLIKDSIELSEKRERQHSSLAMTVWLHPPSSGSQFLVSTLCPTQSGPPWTGGGLVQVRVRVRVPSLLHQLHLLQAVQAGQGQTSARGSTQSAPPLAGGGLSHWRVRNCCPPPSVGHRPQVAQPEIFPSITACKQCFRPYSKICISHL